MREKEIKGVREWERKEWRESVCVCVRERERERGYGRENLFCGLVVLFLRDDLRERQETVLF